MATFFPQSTNPGVLQYIKPTSGTPLQVTRNFTDLAGVSFASMVIKAHPANTGKIYILSNSTAADTTNGTNVIDCLSAGQSFSTSGLYYGGVQPSQFWIDTDTTGSIAIPSVRS